MAEGSWQKEIEFHCSFGCWPFRKTLEISSEGFCWCGEIIPMKSVTRIRWGIDQIRGGILPKRVCVAAFGTDKDEYALRTKQKDFYLELTSKCWKAVGERLLKNLLDDTAAGQERRFGNCLVSETGAVFTEKNVFGAASEVRLAWNEILWNVENGSLCLASKEDPGHYLSILSYTWAWNTHLLSAALALLERFPDKRLSSVKKRIG